MLTKPPALFGSKIRRTGENCMELVDKPFEQIVPCHYYLTQEGVDDALIELSYLEPRGGRFEAVSN